MQPGKRNGIWHRKMCHVNNKKQKATNDRRNGTIKSRKSRTLGKKETYKYLEISKTDTHQTSADERKKNLRVYQENEKSTQNLST